MVTFYGISNNSAVEYPQGTLIETVASENEYIIKRVKEIDNNKNWHFDYIILNRDLEPMTIKRNGWSLKRFLSFSGWNPNEIPIYIKDPNDQTPSDFTFSYERANRTAAFLSANGLGTSALNSILEIFFNASNHQNWLEYLRTRSDIVLDIKYDQSSSIDIQKEDEKKSLKDELEKLKLLNEKLRVKILKFEKKLLGGKK